jgi:hypothetical protein
MRPDSNVSSGIAARTVVMAGLTLAAATLQDFSLFLCFLGGSFLRFYTFNNFKFLGF